MTRRFSSISVQTTLATGVSNTALTIPVATGTGAALMGGVTLTAGNVDQFSIMMDPDLIGSEIMWVTGISGDNLTVLRGQNGTSAIAHNSGAVIKHVITGGDLTYFTASATPTGDLANTGLPFPGATSGVNTLIAPAITGTVTNTLPATTGMLISAESVNAAASKTTPIDADEIPLADSAASFGLKKLTWANAKTVLFTAIGALTGKTTPVDADTFVISDSAASGVGKSLTWANVKATLLAIYNGLYEVIGNYATTATAAGTTTLTVSSPRRQVFTGTTTQSVVLPVTSTLPYTGYQYEIPNKSTGIVTVKSSDGSVIYAIPANTTAKFMCILLTGTTAASWSSDWSGASAAPSGGASHVISSQTVVGSAVATISFPGIAATWKNLRIEYNALVDSGSWDVIRMRFNADAGSNYDSTTLLTVGTTLTGAESIGATSMSLTRAAQVGAASGFIIIPNYAATILKKNVVAQGYSESAESAGAPMLVSAGGHWRNTAAITQIDLTFAGTNWEVGSQLTLYGED